MIHDGVIDMVQFQQMFQRSCPLLVMGLNILDGDGVDINGDSRVTPKETRDAERNRERRKRRKHVEGSGSNLRLTCESDTAHKYDV